MQEQVLCSQSQDLIWLVIVPKRQEFTKPKFHFGERVKWQGEDSNGIWCCKTGRIVGMHFVHSQREWQYGLVLDAEHLQSVSLPDERFYGERSLTLVKDSKSLRQQMKGESEWLSTQQAASRLGISTEQLRKFRRRGWLKVGHHCRDTSMPGSGLPRWQWHLDRCSQALAIPPEKRPAPKS